MSYATVPPSRLLTVVEYLEAEATSPVKHEYVAGQIYAFAGASLQHNRLVARLSRTLLNAAEGGPCEVLGSDMLLRVATDIFYYPDIAVYCNVNETDERYLERPCLVVEVLSPSTASTDLREKRVAYRNIPSLEGYLIAAQETPWVEWHWRDEQDGWQLTRFEGTGEVELPCVGSTLDIAEIYEGLAPATE